jgi:hypothetical protein
MAKNLPIETIKCGPVQLAVFENTIKKGGEDIKTYSVSITKSYKDKDNKWQTTSSFKDSELIYVIMACQKRLENKYLRISDNVDEVDFPND